MAQAEALQDGNLAGAMWAGTPEHEEQLRNERRERLRGVQARVGPLPVLAMPLARRCPCPRKQGADDRVSRLRHLRSARAENEGAKATTEEEAETPSEEVDDGVPDVDRVGPRTADLEDALSATLIQVRPVHE